MCGICGIYNSEGFNPADLQRMLATLSHRGPDDEGSYVNGCVGLGSRRLSIIDLPGGKQPISNEDNTIWIVCNGEIYNYKTLRQNLQEKGHRFRTQSDTEVIVHLYEDLGEQCVAPLNGMFSFAIWDTRTKKLFLARDRLGQKPLYYTCEAGSFLFASEAKAILAVSKAEREMDFLSVHDYLSLRFVPSPQTIFRNISKLPPAHTLVLQNGNLSIRRYWDLSFEDKINRPDVELVEGLHEKLIQTIGAHLESDVPVGAFLSGGLDSSTIVAILSRALDYKPQTFSIGVQESDFDELPYARLVAEHCGTQHTEEKVSVNLIESLPKIIWHLDEPSDPIAACMYQAARLASQNVKVVLGGDGGDELFAGFDRYLGSRYISRYSSMPSLIREKFLGPVLNRIPDSFTYKSITQKLRWVHQISTQTTPAEQYAEATSFFRFSHRDKRALYTKGLWDQFGGIDSARIITEPFNSGSAVDPVDRMLFADYMTRLPEHSLMLTDRMNMAFGLEARSPFLDHELVELMARYPSRLKLQKGRTKALLREITAGYLPDTIVHRKKQGFMFPIAYWFRTDLYPLITQALTRSYFVREGLFSKDTVQRLLLEHRTRRYDHHVRLWMLLNLEIWHQLYIEQAAPEIVQERLQVALHQKHNHR